MARRRVRYQLEQDYYLLLGVDPSATPDEVQRAYRQRAKEVHPDLHPDNRQAKQQFQALNEAYEVLGDGRLRDEYDVQRRAKLGIWDTPRSSATSATSHASADGAPPAWRGNYADPDVDQPDFSHWAERSGVFRSAWKNMLRSYSHRLLFAVLLFVVVVNGCTILLLPEIEGLLGAASAVLTARLAPPPAPNQPSATRHYVVIETTSQPRSRTEPAPSCAAAQVRITSPRDGAEINNDPFDVRGTATDAKFWAYTIEIDSLSSRARWVLRLPTRRPVPDADGLLLEAVSIGNMTTGDYVLRLRVERSDGRLLPACEVRIRRKP
jgi:hypothetical protein